MIVITSLSPYHSNAINQHNSLTSWQGIADVVYSMNCAEEVELLKKENYQGVWYLETCKTLEHFLGKKLVSINAMIDIARVQGKDLLLINSDIELQPLPELKQDGVTLFTRWDWDEESTKANPTKFTAGFDAFFIPKKFLKVFPPSVYAMGAAWWDYFIPYHCIKSNIPLYNPKGIYAYHKRHGTQYDLEQWNYLSQYFQWEFKFDKRLNSGQVATQAINEIRKNLIYI